MSDYKKTTAEDWLKENGLSDNEIQHPNAGEQYVYLASQTMKNFARLVITEHSENIRAHTGYEDDIDFDGAEANTLNQFGL